jgi:hypothetical protein
LAIRRAPTAPWVAAGAALALALALLVWSPVSAVGAPALPIPKQLTKDWKAPAGSYSLPGYPVTVATTVTVDLTAVTNISGRTGYLFRLVNGGRLTINGGNFSGGFQGLVSDEVPDGGTGGVSIQNTVMHGVRSIVYAAASGGPIDIVLTSVAASGLGSGVRATANTIRVVFCTLTGGNKPPGGSPAGIHSLDDSANHIAVPGAYINVYHSTIGGFVSATQGDSILGETRVAAADIEYNVLGYNTDSGGIDSKIAKVVFAHNTVYSYGSRAIVSHYGTLVSYSNTVYQVATTAAGAQGKAYQATGTLIAHDDTLNLVSGALMAAADVATSGSASAATYPRIGNMQLTHITNPNGKTLSGPVVISANHSYRPTVVVKP